MAAATTFTYFGEEDLWVDLSNGNSAKPTRNDQNEITSLLVKVGPYHHTFNGGDVDTAITALGLGGDE